MRITMSKRATVLSIAAGIGCAVLLFSSREARADPGALQAGSAPVESVVKFWLEPPPSRDAGLVERGKWLFHRQGCFLCHGPEGRGGVPNKNYVRDTIPALNGLADRMTLSSAADVNAVVDQMKRGARLEALQASPPVQRYNVFLAQYRLIGNLIRNGQAAAKKDRKGPAPPLNMPPWGQVLSDTDIDAVIAYLLTLNPAGK